MNLSDLNPFPVFINWEGEAIELKPFDLRAITWAERFFYVEGQNGFDRMNRILSKPDDENVLFNTLIDVVHYLGSKDFKAIDIRGPVELKKLISKNNDPYIESAINSAIDYRDTLDDDTRIKILNDTIKKAIGSIEKHETNKKLTEFGEALKQVFKNSFPTQQKEQNTGGEIFNKLGGNKKNDQSETDWDQIYVAFYMAGGMSLDEFYGLTIRQIDYLHPEINYKISEEFSLQASIHGAKLKNKPHRKQRKESTDFNEQDIAAFEKMEQELIKDNKVN